MNNAPLSTVLDDRSSPSPLTPAETGTAADPLAAPKTAIASGVLKKQLTAVSELAAAGPGGWEVLAAVALERSPGPVDLPQVDVLLGRIYQVLQAQPSQQDFLDRHYPGGVLRLPPDCRADYQPLQTALAAGEFQTADNLTLELLCTLAGPQAVQRKWLYFTEVDRCPALDLQTLDALWRIYSEGKFGFSVQREIWLGVGKVWTKLWPKIDWKRSNHWTRWPGEFTWSLDAPPGHLPLTNQLRGVRVMEALMNHAAWNP